MKVDLSDQQSDSLSVPTNKLSTTAPCVFMNVFYSIKRVFF